MEIIIQENNTGAQSHGVKSGRIQHSEFLEKDNKQSINFKTIPLEPHTHNYHVNTIGGTELQGK